MSSYLMSFALVASALAITFLATQTKGGVTQLPLPPGPRRLPWVGNLFQIPSADLPAVFYDWGRKHYGPIFYFKIFGRHLIVLNGLDIILELFEKKSSLSSTRPSAVMVGELMGQKENLILFLPYNQRLRDCRSLMHQWLNPRAMIPLYPQFEQSALVLASRILDTPDDWLPHIRYTTGSLVLKLTYGIKTLPFDDPYLKLAESLIEVTAIGLEQGRWMVDFFPILKHLPSWMPGAGFKRFAEECRAQVEKLGVVPYDFAIDALKEGKPSWIGLGHLENKDPGVMICTGRSVYGAGTDTMVSVLTVFVLLMLHHPDVQKRAQMEIDEIVGHETPPTLKDWDHLPYVQRMCAEILRFNPTVPLAVHGNEEEIEFRGYRIPAGSWLMANARSVTMDPEVFKNPSEFNPDRYLHGEPDVSKYAFGFGRRACPGKDYAMGVVMADVLAVLWAFEILPQTEGTLPPIEYYETIVSHPRPFTCQFVPRSLVKAKTVREMVAAFDL
ncbi:cytochrome P450 [Flagelloscypha sp. PMI_526]|nr:cytochrome P450 [Flagelloscypha sp. PMI_526]